MDLPRLLPFADEPAPERADAARNRAALLVAASELVARCGAEGVTMDAVAARAGVGKGTVFRRFESREGLMGALVDHLESQLQARVISGDPPVGPGAEPLERLVAFGHARIETSLAHAPLIRAAGGSTRAYAAVSFSLLHVRHLLGELGVEGDLDYLATALLAPLEVPILEQQRTVERLTPARMCHGWEDLVRRVVSP